jgi:hypothetical protein
MKGGGIEEWEDGLEMEEKLGKYVGKDREKENERWLD